MDNADRQAKLTAQIRLRLETLRGWLANGVPDGKLCPSSLNKVREWNDPSLGIEKIGSPSSFTSGHKTHGSDVSRIAKLITKLNIPRTKKNKSNPHKQLLKTRAKYEEQQESLVMAANQYATLRIELDKYQKLYRVAQQSQLEAQQELAVAESTIRELKAELVLARARVSKGKITSIDFGGKDHPDTQKQPRT